MGLCCYGIACVSLPVREILPHCRNRAIGRDFSVTEDRMVRKLIGMALLLVGVSQFAGAAVPASAPEIDSTTAVSGLVLLSGALLIIKSRRRK